MTTTLTVALLGALVVLALLAAIVFVRYWRLTRDTFFVWFALAFVTLAVDWGLLAFHAGESAGLSYLVRLLGFVEIIVAILLKNRKSS